MLTPASASGVTTETSTPTSDRSNGPSSSRAHQPRSHNTLGGTTCSGQTIESSPGVRVTEKNDAAVAQAGISEPGSSRQTASRFAKTERRSEVPGVLSTGFPTCDLLYSKLPAGRVRARQTSAI